METAMIRLLQYLMLLMLSLAMLTGFYEWVRWLYRTFAG
jgi:hypothetical protein